MRISVDFDHTLARTIEYPYVIKVTWMNKLVHAYIRHMKKRGHTIIMNTLREGKTLDYAKGFCEAWSIPIDLFNENRPEDIKMWYDSRKIAVDRSIDDTNIGLIGWLLRRFA